MCAPAISAIAGIGVAALQAGASYQAQQADYNAKVAAWRQNIVNSEASARDEYGQILGNQLIEQNKTAQQEHISFLQQAMKQSGAEVSAVSGGVAGISVDNLLEDIASKSGQQRSYADQNYKYVIMDTTNRLKSSTDQEMARINSVPVPQEPSAAAAFATVAGAGVKAFGALSSGGGIGFSLGDA